MSASTSSARLGARDSAGWRGLLRPELTRTQMGIALLRAAILALATALLAAPLTVGAGVAAAVLGTCAGILAAEALRRAPLRSSSLGAGALLLLLIGVGISRMPVRFEGLGNLLGAVPAYQLGEGLLWLSLTAPVFFWLRFASHRRPLVSVLEVLYAASAFAASFAAHRDGMVHRPLAIGDWAWSRGIDPAMVLMGFGGLAALLLAALLVSERQRKRLFLHFGALAAIAVLLFASVRIGGLPVPQPPSGLGLTGDPSEEPEETARGRDGKGGEQDRERRGSGTPRDPGEMEFRDEYDSDGKRSPVAVVVLHDDYAPPTGVYYFRQSAQSQFNGNRLVQATRSDVDGDIIPLFPSEPMTVGELPPITARRTELRTTIGLIVDHVRPFGHDSPAQIRPVPNPDPLRFQRAFEVRSAAPMTPYENLLGQRAGSPDWDASQRRHYTELPSDPRYLELAQEITSKLPDDVRDDPLAQALTIKFHLEEVGIYSLKSSHASADDPTASFLFGDVTGYCVHFSHAATYLFRSLGIPARVAVGYAVPESHRGEGSAIMIRGANAHAWPEIYLEKAGWTVVDLAPEQTLDPPLAEPDSTLQSMLGEMMRKRPGEEDEYLESARVLPTLAELLRATFWLLLATVLLGAAVKAYRRLVPQFAHGPRLYVVTYRAALDQLADVGLRRRFGESRERFATRARELAPSFDVVTGQHVAWALGSRRLMQPDALPPLTEQLRAELEKGVPTWRRILGWLNPFSWLGVR